MTKGVSTAFGEPLSTESKKLINEVRLKLNQPIHPNFDTDFNVYRFVLAAERLHKNRKEVIENAARALNNHLRIRKALQLDTRPDTAFDENPIFQKRLMPRGEIQTMTDTANRLLWYIEYASISVESIAHSLRSSEACKYQFWQFDHMLRKVMAQEEKTGKLSSLRHIVDMHGYEINPFTMLFVSSGTLAYYSQLFHYENYPELVTPVDIVNIPRWIHVPYRLARAMMPAGFTDRFRLHDGNYLPEISKDIAMEHIPESLGGQSKGHKCVHAKKLDSQDYWQPKSEDLLKSLESLHVTARKTRAIHLDVVEPRKLSWYFKTDGDIYFGVFYEPNEMAEKKPHSNDHIEHEHLEMVYPWLKLTAKIVHEWDELDCSRPGRYSVVFCNKHSWLHRRTVDLRIHVSLPDGSDPKRLHTDGTFSISNIELVG